MVPAFTKPAVTFRDGDCRAGTRCDTGWLRRLEPAPKQAGDQFGTASEIAPVVADGRGTTMPSRQQRSNILRKSGLHQSIGIKRGIDTASSCRKRKQGILRPDGPGFPSGRRGDHRGLHAPYRSPATVHASFNGMVKSLRKTCSGSFALAMVAPRWRFPASRSTGCGTGRLAFGPEQCDSTNRSAELVLPSLRRNLANALRLSTRPVHPRPCGDTYRTPGVATWFRRCWVPAHQSTAPETSLDRPERYQYRRR